MILKCFIKVPNLVLVSIQSNQKGCQRLQTPGIQHVQYGDQQSKIIGTDMDNFNGFVA